jgi:hypothetical protein
MLLVIQFCLLGFSVGAHAAGRNLPYDGIFGNRHHRVIVSKENRRISERRMIGDHTELSHLNPTVLLQLLQKEREGRMKAEIAESRARGENKRLNRLISKYEVCCRHC